MKKCFHVKNKNQRCGVPACENYAGKHWPLKKGAKKPADTYKPHDVNPIHKVHNGVGSPLHKIIKEES